MLIVASPQIMCLSQKFIEIISAIQTPIGHFQVITGNFTDFKRIIADRRVSVVIHSGSREHCNTLRKESLGHPHRQLILNPGGKNAAILHSSANMESSIELLCESAFRDCGQLKSACSQVFVYRNRLEEFKEALIARLSRFHIGPALESPDMGPLYSEKSLDKFFRFQTMGHREAEDTWFWGKRLDQYKGNFVTPSVHYFGEFDPSSSFQQNVWFSPILSVYVYDRLDSVFEAIDSSEAPFVTSFFGEDIQAIRQQTTRLLSSNVLINLPTTEFDALSPVSNRLYSRNHKLSGGVQLLNLVYPQFICEKSQQK